MPIQALKVGRIADRVELISFHTAYGMRASFWYCTSCRPSESADLARGRFKVRTGGKHRTARQSHAALEGSRSRTCHVADDVGKGAAIQHEVVLHSTHARQLSTLGYAQKRRASQRF